LRDSDCVYLKWLGASRILVEMCLVQIQGRGEACAQDIPLILAASNEAATKELNMEGGRGAVVDAIADLIAAMNHPEHLQ